MAWPTAKEILNDAAVELGLIDADLADPFASSDQAIVQLIRLLRSAGRHVLREPSHAWTQLVKEYTFTTVASQKVYALPSDFRRMIPQSEWNRTDTRRLGGPLSPQGWQACKGTALTGSAIVYARRVGTDLWLYEDGLAGSMTIAFEYLTSWWSSATGGTAPTKEYPEASTDLVYFDGHLMSRALKLKWAEAKKFDSTSELQDYQAALAQAADDNAPGRVLSFGGPVPEHFIDESNLPYTGYLT